VQKPPAVAPAQAERRAIPESQHSARVGRLGWLLRATTLILFAVNCGKVAGVLTLPTNYFMLNLLVNYARPENVSRVSGIPQDWRRSGYNSRAQSPQLFRQLLGDIDAPFLLVSFNNEGFISRAAMEEMLREIGQVKVFEIPYNTYRGARNLRNRPPYVTESLFLVDRT